MKTETKKSKPLSYSQEDEVFVSCFSNGSEAMDWYDSNCCSCKRGCKIDWDNPPSDKTMRHYVAIGRECEMKFNIDYGFITGEVPLSTVMKIGARREYEEGDKHLPVKWRCSKFSDDDNDRYKWPKRTPPDNPMQMVMPFILDEMGVRLNEETLSHA